MEAHCCFTRLCLQQPHREACEKLNGLEHSLINNSKPGNTELQGTAWVLPALTWEGEREDAHQGTWSFGKVEMQQARIAVQPCWLYCDTGFGVHRG